MKLNHRFSNSVDQTPAFFMIMMESTADVSLYVPSCSLHNVICRRLTQKCTSMTNYVYMFTVLLMIRLCVCVCACVSVKRMCLMYVRAYAHVCEC